jgi:hypothetical protein
MPEIWIPYGGVETLVTLQAENLGTIAEPEAEAASVETERMTEIVKEAAQVFVCDAAPATLEFLRGLAPAIEGNMGLRFVAPAPKRIESGVPELKGRLTTLPPPLPPGEGEEPFFASQLMEKGSKLFVGSARPDPMFGVLDAKAEACLNWVAGSRGIAADATRGMEPQPLQKSGAYDALEGLVGQIPESKFLTLVSRNGKLRTAMEDPPFDAIRNAFPKIQMPQARGLVLGAGGRGYDDTFSSALRGVWSAIQGVRRAGLVLMIAECSEGVGSSALEMLVTGRSAEGGRRKDRYVEGLEEVFYLNKLKDEYEVLLLSGLPESYARSKLGLTTARGSGEAVGRMLNRLGRSGKLNVVPRAPECLVVSG